MEISFTTEKDELHNKELCFTSWQKEIKKVHAGLDIVTSTSLNEGTPVSLIEAQAANNPVVSTNVGGIGDIIIENKTALLADKNNYYNFAKQLKRVIEDKSLRNIMSDSGLKFVKNKFNYKRLVNDMSHLYKKLLVEYETN